MFIVYTHLQSNMNLDIKKGRLGGEQRLCSTRPLRPTFSLSALVPVPSGSHLHPCNL